MVQEKTPGQDVPQKAAEPGLDPSGQWSWQHPSGDIETRMEAPAVSPRDVYSSHLRHGMWYG